MGPDVTQRTWRRVRVCPTRYDVRAKSVFVVTRLGLRGSRFEEGAGLPWLGNHLGLGLGILDIGTNIQYAQYTGQVSNKACNSGSNKAVRRVATGRGAGSRFELLGSRVSANSKWSILRLRPAKLSPGVHA
jgi:hypothetical protein